MERHEPEKNIQPRQPAVRLVLQRDVLVDLPQLGLDRDRARRSVAPRSCGPITLSTSLIQSPGPELVPTSELHS
jgi:hypothetical protein